MIRNSRKECFGQLSQFFNFCNDCAVRTECELKGDESLCMELGICGLCEWSECIQDSWYCVIEDENGEMTKTALKGIILQCHKFAEVEHSIEGYDLLIENVFGPHGTIYEALDESKLGGLL